MLIMTLLDIEAEICPQEVVVLSGTTAGKGEGHQIKQKELNCSADTTEVLTGCKGLWS